MSSEWQGMVKLAAFPKCYMDELRGTRSMSLFEWIEIAGQCVVTIHASDRSLKPGYTLDDLRAQEDSVGYASILQHGEIGTGLNDFDRIFSILKGCGFDGWVSIEDGVEGLDELRHSAAFLRRKMAKYWPA